jgi:hypothetical protein
MHDRLLFPRQMENCRGEPVFDLSAAKLLLRTDVADGKHLTMKPLQLKLTRDEYKPYSVCENPCAHFGPAAEADLG